MKTNNFIKPLKKLSFCLFVYLIFLSRVGVTESIDEKRFQLQQIDTISQHNKTHRNPQLLFNEAEKLVQQRTLQSHLQALEKYIEARLKWQKLGDRNKEALTLLKIGETYKNIGAITPALENYKSALNLYQQLEKPLQKALILNQMGEAYIAELEQLEEEKYFALVNNLSINSRWQDLFLDKQQNNSKKALELYQQSLEIYQKLNNDSDSNIDQFIVRQAEANLLNKMAQVDDNDDDEKEQLLQKSLAIYQAIGDKQGEALVLGYLSELNRIKYSNYQAAEEQFNQAITIYTEIANSSNYDNFTARQAEANLLRMAADYWWLENQQKALEYYNQSLIVYRNIEDKQGEAQTLSSIADNYAELENREKQSEFYTQALLIYQEIEDRIGEAKVLNSLGDIYYLSEDIEKSLEYYRQTLEKNKEISQFYTQLKDSETALTFDYRQPIILFKIGKLYSQLENDANELEVYNQAREIYQKWEDAEGETNFLIEVAKRYSRQENSERMLEFLNDAVAVYQEKDNLFEKANLLRNQIANLYFYSLKDIEKGFNTLNQALTIYQEIGNFAKVAQTFDKIGNFYLDISENQLENKEKAIEFYNQAVTIYHNIQDFDSERFTLTKIGEIYYEIGNKEKALEAFNQAGKVHKQSGEYEKAINTLIEIAQTYTDWGEKETALEFYQQIIPISKQLGDYKREALTLRIMAQLYYELEDVNKAIETFNQARKVYQKNNDNSGEAWTIYEIGKNYTILGDFKKAIDFYQQALPMYEQEIDAAWREERSLDMLIRMSRIYAYLGESEKALNYCNKSLNYAQKMFQEKRINNSERFREIGKLCYQIGQKQIAFKSFKQYEIIYQQIGQDRAVLGLMRIGEDYTELGDFEQALEYLNRARKIYQETGFNEGEIDNISWIARIYNNGGNYQQAISYLNQGLKVAQQINNQTKEASILTEIADIYSELEDEENAFKFYNQALSLYKQLNNYRQQTELLEKIGQFYQQSGELEKALTFFQQALAIASKNNFYDRSNHSRNVAKVYFELGELDKSLDYFKQALKSPNALSSLYTEIGKVYSDLGELEQALKSFNNSLDLQENNYSEYRAENYFGIAKVERKKNNYNIALTHIKIAIGLIEETRITKNSPEERLTFFASKQDYYEFYIDLLMELHQQNQNSGYDAEAFNISERSKARSLLELLTEANVDIRKGVEPELVIQEQSLQQQLDTVERRRIELYNSENDNLEQKAAIEQERQYLLHKYEEVQTEIREKSPNYAAITQPQPLTLKQIQQQILDEDTLLLQYYLGEKRSFVWAITKDSITSYQLPSKELIEPEVRNFIRQIIMSKRGGFKQLSQTSKSLYKMILAPIENQLNYRRLAIVSDGILHYIPFAALSQPAASSETEYLPLIEKYEIVNLPSASTLGILRQEYQQQPASKTIAILADPVFSSEDDRLQNTTSVENETWEQYQLNRASRQLDIGVWNRLPATRTEAEAILSLIPESESYYALDFAANRTAVTNSQLNQYQIIHFATHGLFNSINPELSGIILSMIDSQGNPLNGFLRLHDIFNLNFSADLVVLSACQTGLGKQVKGEGLIGLTRGFMYAGTPRVLVSLWNVDDVATAEMMTRFYRLLLTEKLSATAALKQAQLEMQTETEWKSPYYWAAFTLQGEWQ
ncbi:MAG: tetratricopeptide repeat protein [Microcoleaceae cyanobacterium]